MKYNYTTLNNNYLTPPEVYQPILKKLGLDKFDVDVCCSTKNIPAITHFINGEVDGLTADWGEINWMNPPFSTCEKWIKKAAEEQKKGKTTYSILPVRTETAYWRDYILNKRAVKIHWITKNNKTGVTFIDPSTGDYVRNEKGEKGLFKNPLAIVIFKGIKKNG